MKLAVLMSTYNGEKFIRQQIDSILAQQCQADVELIVRDDGSTDSTRQILETYAQAGKLRWYHGENLKPAKSFLDLVCHCPGYDYYAFADQDDYWHPNKLQSGMDMLGSDTRPAMAFANARLVDENLEYLGRNVYNKVPNHDFYSVLCGGGILGCTVTFNSQLAQLVQTYPNPEKLIMHDSYIAILCTLFDGKIHFDNNPHMDYRQHGHNVVGTQWTKLDAIKNRIQRITVPQKVSISEMAQSILDQKPQVTNKDKLCFLQQVADYRRSVFSAIGLACSGKPTYNSKNMAVTMRLAMLMRNR